MRRMLAPIMVVVPISTLPYLVGRWQPARTMFGGEYGGKGCASEQALLKQFERLAAEIIFDRRTARPRPVRKGLSQSFPAHDL